MHQMLWITLFFSPCNCTATTKCVKLKLGVQLMFDWSMVPICLCLKKSLVDQKIFLKIPLTSGYVTHCKKARKAHANSS